MQRRARSQSPKPSPGAQPEQLMITPGLRPDDNLTSAEATPNAQSEAGFSGQKEETVQTVQNTAGPGSDWKSYERELAAEYR